ncbi:MAG: FHA domain-containing protein, partial [Pirellulaceae bacterium]|nr:FHA domain-containing protein [Pirellulaceae bacterium]
MPSLVARDLRKRQTIYRRWSLTAGVDLPLGREVGADQLLTHWDDLISARHAVVRWEQNKLFVAQNTNPLPKNGIFYNGQQTQVFSLIPGEGFVIGRTVFQLDPVEIGSPSSDASRSNFVNPEMLLTMLSPGGEHLEVVDSLLQHLQDRELDIAAFEEKVVVQLKRVVRRADFAAILRIRDKKIERHAAAGDLGICQPLVL